MARKTNGKPEQFSLRQLIDKLNDFYDAINEYQSSDLKMFKSTMQSFRTFLQESTLVDNGYTTAFNHLIANSKEYQRFKIKFTHAENFFERIIELEENEKIVYLSSDKMTVKILEDSLTDEFNKLFLDDVQIELSKLKTYISKGNFVMVGCGSLPITLIVFSSVYSKISFVGIDNSPEAIKKAIDLKQKFHIVNLDFNIIDGVNYDYNDVSTIFVANTVIQKNEVLKQIAMSAKSGTKIIIRNPVLSGNLLSEEVTQHNIPRIKLLEEISPDIKTDDDLYKLLVFEVR